MKNLNKEFLKFIVSGALNTLATYIIYLLLLNFISYSISYTVSYISGIFLSYYLNSLFVFKEKLSLKKFLKYPIVYIVQYIINLFMVFLFVEKMGFSARFVPLVVILITLPITYLLSKIIIKEKK